LRITSESFTPSAGEQQPHVRDVLEALNTQSQKSYQNVSRGVMAR
jgi:hypothetical protein